MSKHTPRLEGSEVLPPMVPTQPKSSTNGRQAPRAKKNAKRRKTGNRFALLNSFVDVTLGGLNRSEIAVWLVLYRDTRDGSTKSSQADIARRAGTSTRTVRRVIRSLEQRGLIRTVYQGGLRRGVSRYHVTPLEEPP